MERAAAFTTTPERATRPVWALATCNNGAGGGTRRQRVVGDGAALCLPAWLTAARQR